MKITTQSARITELHSSPAIHGEIVRPLDHSNVYLKWSAGLDEKSPVSRVTVAMTPTEAIQYAHEVLRVAGATNIAFDYPVECLET